MEPFFVWWGHWRGVWGVGSPSGVSTPKSIRPKKPPASVIKKKAHLFPYTSFTATPASAITPPLQIKPLMSSFTAIPASA